MCSWTRTCATPATAACDDGFSPGSSVRKGSGGGAIPGDGRMMMLADVTAEDDKEVSAKAGDILHCLVNQGDGWAMALTANATCVLAGRALLG